MPTGKNKDKLHRGLVIAMLLISGIPAFWFTKFFVCDGYQFYSA